MLERERVVDGDDEGLSVISCQMNLCDGKQPISPRRPNALPFIYYSQRVGHSSGHVEQTSPFPEERPLPPVHKPHQLVLINSHIQAATGAFKSVRPCLHFHRLPQQNQCYRSWRS
ncbi:hypothetical protein CDAR_557771 [Caerostris darwini]|uniref:Uncharacterized protein n=1 Tax=Caerostris darwini TaxID=1538125 RepID=A0AAV4RGU3_9ARAC|nr:hypothetical protein CDAR_557771 [Caerostris darwini]